MGAINPGDDYIHRLGKLVPVYVLAMITAVQGFLAFFTDQTIQILVFASLILAAFLSILGFEFINQKNRRLDQIIILGISSILYITAISNLTFGWLEGSEWSLFLSLIAVLWTFIVPAVVQQ